MDPKSSSCGERMLALYEYTAERPDELSFKEGDIIEVVYKDCPEGWWVGKLNDKTGLFPLNFVQQMPANNDNNENVLRINPISGINLQISLPNSETPAQQSCAQMQGSSCGVKQTGHDTTPIPNKRDLFRNVRQQNGGGGGSTTTTTTTTTSQEVTPEQLEHMSKQLHDKLTNTKDEPKFDLEAGADRAIQNNKDKDKDNKDAELISLLLSAQIFLKNYSKQSTERMNLENQRITMLKNLIDHKAVMLENLSDRVNTYLGQQKKTYQEASSKLEQVRQQLQQAKSQNHQK